MKGKRFLKQCIKLLNRWCLKQNQGYVRQGGEHPLMFSTALSSSPHIFHQFSHESAVRKSRLWSTKMAGRQSFSSGEKPREDKEHGDLVWFLFQNWKLKFDHWVDWKTNSTTKLKLDLWTFSSCEVMVPLNSSSSDWSGSNTAPRSPGNASPAIYFLL